MCPRSATRAAAPAAAALASRIAGRLGEAFRDERRRRSLTLREVGARARVSYATVQTVESGGRASLDVYARLASALGMSLDLLVGQRHRREPDAGRDPVHSAMGELEATLLRAGGAGVAIDYPYQHYQFAGRADVLAWTQDPPALLHIENRTRFPDIQAVAGSFNAKRRYLAASAARQLGIARLASETHVIVGLWSAEVLHSVRLRPATFGSMCPDGAATFFSWLRGEPPGSGVTSTFVVLDPLAAGRQRRMIGLDAVLAGARPRFRDYRQAAERLHAAGRA